VSQQDHASEDETPEQQREAALIPGLDATEIVPGLFLGAAPRAGMVTGDHFDTLWLVTDEYQPGDDDFPGIEVRRLKLHDDPHELDLKMVGQAVTAGRRVAGEVAKGERVLVTCARGLNRSAFVVALALMTLGQGKLSAHDAIQLLREVRGDDVLRESDIWQQVLMRYFAR
jgi:hypothetical protein